MSGNFSLQPLAQQHFVVPHWPVPLAIERNQDLAVGRGNVRNIALREAAPCVRDPDVVEDRVDLVGRKGSADLLLDVGEAELGLLDSRARRACAREAASCRRPRRERNRGRPAAPATASRATRPGTRSAPAPDAAATSSAGPCSGSAAARTIRSTAMEAPAEPLASVSAGVVHRDFASQQVVHHRRHQRPREQVRRHHREHHRHRQRREQVLRRAGQQQHRHEHDADGQRGRRTSARRSATRRRAPREPAACPWPGCDACSRFRPSRRPPGCRRPAPARPAS